MDFKDLIKTRRSMRKFTPEKISKEEIASLMRAALMSPSSKGTRGWEFVLVEDEQMLSELSKCRDKGAELVAGAAMAVVVIGNPEKSDVWIEDASIAALMIQLQAEELGLGSCWVQVRNRVDAEGTGADERVKALLGIPSNLSVLNMVALGHKGMERKPFDESKLLWSQVHEGKF